MKKKFVKPEMGTIEYLEQQLLSGSLIPDGDGVVAGTKQSSPFDESTNGDYILP